MTGINHVGDLIVLGEEGGNRGRSTKDPTDHKKPEKGVAIISLLGNESKQQKDPRTPPKQGKELLEKKHVQQNNKIVYHAGVATLKKKNQRIK